MRPNWFIAFPIDGSFLEVVPRPPSLHRLFHRDDVHLTLTFLGSVDSGRAERAFAALQRALEIEPLAPIQLSFGAVVPMGRARAYTALSAFLNEGREAMDTILLRYRDLLAEAAELSPDRRPPKPHVTLARPARRAGEAHRAAGLAWADGLDLTRIRTRIDRVALYTWATVRTEKLFRIVREWPLTSAS